MAERPPATEPAGAGHRGHVPAAIAARALQLSARGHFWRPPRALLRGVDLTVAPGEGVALLGHNGAGKTTLLRVLLGLQRVDAGTAQLFGVATHRPMARRGLGYVPERACYPQRLDAHTFVAAHARLAGLCAHEADGAAARMLARVGLQRDARRPLAHASKGMLQRAGLAQALVARPRLLLLDEPFDGLDPAGRAELRALVAEERARGCSLLFCTHVVADVADVCDRAVVLARGRVTVDVRLDERMASATGPHGRVLLQVGALSAAARAALLHLVTPAPPPASPETFVAENLERANAALDAVRAAGGRLVAMRPLDNPLETLLGDGAPCA